MQSSIVLVLASVVLGVFADELPPEYKKITMECAEEFHIQESQLKDDNFLLEDKPCFYKCLFDKSGVMDAHGNIHLDELKSQIQKSPSIAHWLDKMDRCSSIKKNELCETALEIVKCFHK